MELIIRKRLAVIDDDYISHFIVKRTIELYFPETEVTSYFSAKEVLQLLRDGEFPSNVIFVDINMPLMSGWDFMNELARTGCTIPLYILTSSSSPDDRKRIHQYQNVVEYLEKPIDKDHLSTILAMF